MNPVKKPEYSDAILGVNPFTHNITIPCAYIPVKEYKDEGDGILINRDIKIEATPFTRFFTRAEDRKIVNLLSDKGKSLLLWLVYELEYGKDYLWINKDRYMEEAEVKSYTTYSNAVKELIRYGFLAHTVVKEVFWINPTFIFKGNRITKYAHLIKEK